jgi:hypothetical protein
MKRKTDLLPLVNFFAETLRETLDNWDVSQAEVSRTQPALTHTCWERICHRC